MTIHSIHIFDRKGATLFTKNYSRAALKQELHLQQTGSSEPGSSPLDEQRKLVFGMLFSLSEIIGKLTPVDDSSGEWNLRYLKILLSRLPAPKPNYLPKQHYTQFKQEQQHCTVSRQ